MKLSITFPLVTKSENALRSLPFAVANAPKGKQLGMAIGIARKVEQQRAEVRRVLDAHLPRPRRLVPDPDGIGVSFHRANRYRVTLTRIGAGLLDTDGLQGALKHVRDEVAAWLGIGDGPRDPATWTPMQALCTKKFYLVRIEIDDADPTREGKTVLLGAQPPFISDAVSEGAPVHKPLKRARTKRVSTVAGDIASYTRAAASEEARILAAVAAGGQKATQNVAAALRGRLGAEIYGSSAPAHAKAETVELSYGLPADVHLRWARVNGWPTTGRRKVFYIDPRTQRRVLIPNAADPPPRLLRLHSEVDGVPFVAATLTARLVGDVWIYDEDTTPDGYVEGVEAKKAALKAARARGART